MATITKFEELEIGLEARRLSKEIISIANNTDLNKDFRFKAQIKDSAGSVMIILPRDLREMAMQNSDNFYPLQKDLQEKVVLNYIDFMTMGT